MELTNSEIKSSKISIITVVYNSVDLIKRTIESIIGQTYKNTEHIIVDGDSTDGTVDIIKKYKKQIAQWISEPDQGLYDAMNKGLKMATGDYVVFINSGDTFYTSEVLSSIFKMQQNSDIIYGDTMIVDTDGKDIGLRRLRPPNILTWKSLQKGMVVCHQSFIVKREIAPLYDLRYKHSADIDWEIKCLKASKSIHNSGQIIAAFLDSGISKQTVRKSVQERFHIMVKNYGLIATVFNHFFLAIRFMLFVLGHRRF